MPDLRVAALFAGQGSQYVDMGITAALNVPTLTRAFDDANAVFAGASTRLGSVVFPPPAFTDEEREAQEMMLRRTEFAQPAIGALAAGQFRFLAELGLAVTDFAGHSFGELTALWASGSLSDNDFHALARARGAAMAPSGDGDRGTMLAVPADRDRVEEMLDGRDDIWLCNHNAPDQVVVGGGTDAVERFAADARDAGLNVRQLPVSAAFHTPTSTTRSMPFVRRPRLRRSVLHTESCTPIRLARTTGTTSNATATPWSASCAGRSSSPRRCRRWPTRGAMSSSSSDPRRC